MVHYLNRTKIGGLFAYLFVPFYYVAPESHSNLTAEQVLEMEQHVTFDALTPWHDHPMRSKTFREIIESEGFDIQFIHDPRGSPVYCTAIRTHQTELKQG
jgi:hypothetical protein